MDMLADVLDVTRLGNAVVARTELRAPWGIEVGAHYRAAIHIMLRGSCSLRLDGEKEIVSLDDGDLVLVARGLKHWLSDHPRTPSTSYEEAVRLQQRMVDAKAGAAREPGVLLCAEYAFEEAGAHPLLASLPKVIRVEAKDARREPGLAALVGLLANEASRQQAGSDLVVPRLLDSLLVFAVRAWLAGTPSDATGWFTALRDPQIGRALSLIHERPSHRWTVEELADCASQSRAAFARRFAQLVGEPPMVYVTRWRMSLAAKLLKSTEASVEAISAKVGYDSSPAFGKAFRRHLRMSPGRYRRLTRSMLAPAERRAAAV